MLNIFRMFSLFDELPTSADGVQEHLEAMSLVIEDGRHEKLFGHLYGCLSILDDKCSSLLSANSIVFGVYALIIAVIDGASKEYLFLSGMTVSIVSSIILLSVVKVHWSTTEELQDEEGHAKRLLLVRKRRTIAYRFAWNLSFASYILMASYPLMMAFNITIP